MDKRLKSMMKELGDAINNSLSDSDEIADVISRIKAGGYDVFVVLEATIGFNSHSERRIGGGVVHDCALRCRVRDDLAGFEVSEVTAHQCRRRALNNSVRWVTVTSWWVALCAKIRLSWVACFVPMCVLQSSGSPTHFLRTFACGASPDERHPGSAIGGRSR